MKKKETEINFEEGMKKLDGIVEKLEKGNIPLEEALKQFDSGVQLVRLLNKKLDDAERKIEMLLKDKDGSMIKKEMEFENGELKEKMVESKEQTVGAQHAVPIVGAIHESPKAEERRKLNKEIDKEDDENDEGNKTPTLF